MFSVIFDEWINELRGWNRSYKKHLRRCFYYLEIKMLISLLLFFFFFWQIMCDVISCLGFYFPESYKEQKVIEDSNPLPKQKKNLWYCSLWKAKILSVSCTIFKKPFLFICTGGIFSWNRKCVLSAFKLYCIMLSWECSASW